jgi:asparagine synthase (glutamine-hydrolysing)
MCGIAGIMTRDGSAPDGRLLDRLAAALAHRGPDGEGRHVELNVGLVQRRLAIIDLATGDQPFHEAGGAALVANAEIYNYVELRAAMDGVAFQTRSDCEPALHLYRRHGLDFVQHLRGMYAIAIHDPAADRLVLARDPFGIKPLYYAETDRLFAFASEPQALIAAGLAGRALRDTGVSELLQLQFTTGAETIFAGIMRVAPGETLVVAGGRIVERRQRQALPPGPPEAIEEEEALRRLDAALADSVAMHQRSDVGYGLFLSGGIDSAAVLALMARLGDRPVMAFTIGFADASVADEREAARRVARSVGAEHVEVTFSEADFWSLLPEVARVLDEPVADYAVLPTYKLASVARQAVKVVLSGEGGDELFGGYGRYRALGRPWWLGGRAPRARGRLDGLGLLRQPATGWRDGIEAATVRAGEGGRTPLQVAQWVDCADWLSADLLTKLDRCLMAHGVEGRTPFLDPVVAAAAFRLPDRLKLRAGLGKWLLRRWLDGALPAARPFERKRGFTVPVSAWIARHGKRLGPLVAAEPGVARLCHPDAVARLFEHPGRRTSPAAWTLLFYALWHRQHALGLAAEGDVFATLAA